MKSLKSQFDHSREYPPRHVQKLKTAAINAGIQNVTLYWHNGHGIHYVLHGETKDLPILMDFDPRQRGSKGGSTTKKTKSFLAKRDWAEKEGFLFYVPTRSQSALEMEMDLKFIRMRHETFT